MRAKQESIRANIRFIEQRGKRYSIVEGLRRRKIEVFSARELGYLGKSDEFHIKNVSIGQCIRGVELIARVLTDKNMENYIEFL